MDIQELNKLIASSEQSKALVKVMCDNSIRNTYLEGLTASATPLMFASIAEKITSVCLFILDDAEDAGYFYHDLTQILGQEHVLFYPSSYRRRVKYAQHDAANEILRTEVLSRLSVHTDGYLYVVTHPEAIGELVVSRKKLSEHTITLKVGDIADITELCKAICDMGFKQMDYVYEPGQIALRGSILDVYSYSSEYPFRIDFFGDEIDSIRTFEVQDQLSKEKKNVVDIVPELTSSINEKVSMLSFLDDNTVIATKDLLFVRDVIDKTYKEGFALQAKTELLEGKTEIEQQQIINELKTANVLMNGISFMDEIQRFRHFEFGIKPSLTSDANIKFSTSPQPLFHKNFDMLADCLLNYSSEGYTTYILADSEKQNERLKDILTEELKIKRESLNRIENDSNNIGNCYNSIFFPISKTLHAGFTDNKLKLCIFTDHQIFDRFHKYSLRSDTARKGKAALTMKELQELEPGDYIVHVDFGIGRFAGLVRVPSGDGYQEVIRIIYQNNDKVDVSIHSLYKISRYKRRDSATPPRLSTLGTGAWERLKERTKKKIKDIARDLIKLYAKRRHEKGFAFSTDSYLQQELEANFLYEDTPDQLKATNEVKADMESSRPMDRLICGDVGFGKTEIAIRAAFKAVCDSKQVAVLVPTTVLAYQHYQTFMNRLKDMPVTVDYLSRARNAKKSKEVLENLEKGKIDIIIGTQKLVSKNVKFKELGLLIIDEEQKFGVATKEKLRKLKTNVDTLTLSATPIPRTLQFSLMGARDMSIIKTPPPNRYPIATEVHIFDKEVITEAINFEMSRNGQVFFVNNRIGNLNKIANTIHKYVPDARIAIGHGQMKPEDLEKILMGFINYDYDVLLSTTIVENGIDISNANTIIINDAHHFGLSDLHQMRGRVGRSNRKAFCYLLTPPKATLTNEAKKRLEALETFSDLGSGFNLSMQDLDIRGAGNLLGAEQSGFMEDLGYETYQKILNQAVTELRNDEFSDLYNEEHSKRNNFTGDVFVEDCAIESDLQMYLPQLYVPSSSERMLLYHELEKINTDEDINKFKTKLVDRFGKIPHEGEELLQVVPLRRIGRRLGFEKIILRQNQMRVQLVSNPQSGYYNSETFDKVIDYITKNPQRCNIKEVKGKRMVIVSCINTVSEAVNLLREINK